MDKVTASSERPLGVLELLSETAAARREIEGEESELVRRASMEGFPWQAIADALGVSRQAVHKKHGKR